MCEYGAAIERGIVKSAADGKYTVESLSRSGIITPPLSALYSGPVQVDDMVYFFLFDDGRGAILMLAE